MEAIGVLLIVIGIVFVIGVWTGTLDQIAQAVLGE
jgi:hypothetical protein